eukprot:7443782-Alexandrium_andersonii.AAC.1
MVGYPLAWHKTTAGPAVTWVGACLEITPEGVRVTIPEKKLQEVLGTVAQIFRAGFTPKRPA